MYATESTAFAPSMVSFKDKLYLAWVSDDTKINIGEVAEHQLENKVNDSDEALINFQGQNY